MASNRIKNHPVLGKLDLNSMVPFTFNGNTYYGRAGESLGAALLANNIRILRKHEKTGSGRGIYCNIGHCFECRVSVNNGQGVRACLTPLQKNMEIKSGTVLPNPVKDWIDKNG